MGHHAGSHISGGYWSHSIQVDLTLSQGCLCQLHARFGLSTIVMRWLQCAVSLHVGLLLPCKMKSMNLGPPINPLDSYWRENPTSIISTYLWMCGRQRKYCSCCGPLSLTPGLPLRCACASSVTPTRSDNFISRPPSLLEMSACKHM